MNNNETFDVSLLKPLAVLLANTGIVAFSVQIQPILGCIVMLLTAVYTFIKIIQSVRKNGNNMDL